MVSGSDYSFRHGFGRSLLLCSFAALCGVLVMSQIWSVSSGMGVLELINKGLGGRWLTVIRLDNNAYHLWSIDPFIRFLSSKRFIADIFAGANLSNPDAVSIWSIQLTVFIFGLVSFLKVTDAFSVLTGSRSVWKPFKWISWVVSAILIGLTVGIVIPLDIVSLGSICWLPLIFSLMCVWGDLPVAEDESCKVIRLKRVSIFSALGVVALMHLLSASFLAPLTLVTFGGLLGWSFYTCSLKQGEIPNFKLNLNLRKILGLGAFVLFIIWIALIWQGAAAPLPDYPFNATVVPDDGVPGITRPLSSSDYRLMVSHPYSMRFWWGPTSVVLLGLILVLLIERCIARGDDLGLKQGRLENVANLSDQSKLRQNKPGWKLAGFLGVCCLLDLYLPANLQEIAPVASFSRIFPGAFLIPIVPILIALNVLVILLSTLSDERNPRPTKFFGCIVLLGALSLMNATKNQGCRLEGIRDTNYVSNSNVSNNQGDSKEVSGKEICQSPSRWLVTNYGEPIVKGYKKWPQIHSGPLPLSKALAFNSSQTETNLAIADSQRASSLAQILVDHHNNTRWASANYGQRGNEWLRLDFSQETALNGVLLATGDFKSDFPAALRVECIKANATIAEVFRVSQWLGPILFTEAGYPYYGSPGDVRVIFPESQRCISLIIHQTGRRPFLDWSVAEVRGLYIDTNTSSSTETPTP